MWDEYAADEGNSRAHAREHAPERAGRTDQHTGGDPACWLAFLCPECGRVAEQPSPSRCGYCGADLTDD